MIGNNKVKKDEEELSKQLKILLNIYDLIQILSENIDEFNTFESLILI